jgi:hypothetical protein
MSRRECLARRTDEGHLFVCPFCRADARIAAAWKDLAIKETPAPADERFIAAVLNDVRHETVRQSRNRFWLAAAAAALFFFFTGLALEDASKPAATTPEESYATLAAPNALEGLLPQ